MVRLGSSEPPFYTQPHPKLLAPHLAALLPLVVSSVINLLRTMLFQSKPSVRQIDTAVKTRSPSCSLSWQIDTVVKASLKLEVY